MKDCSPCIHGVNQLVGHVTPDFLTLTFMEPWIARCIFYITNKLQLIQCSLLLHWTTKFNFFFVPRPSIDEISSTFYAEFRYAHRIFLSGRISKIQRTLFVQNSTLYTNEKGRNLPLKCRGVWFSSVIGVRYILLQCPAIVCQHTWGPLALLPLFLSQNVLVKSFTTFITDFAEIFWEQIQVGLQKVDFQTHIAIHSFVRSRQVLRNILIVLWFVIS